MELDELKSLWQKHDEQLENTLQLNDKILLYMKLDRVTHEFRKMMKSEQFSILLGAVAITVIVYFTIRYSSMWPYVVSGVMAVGVMSVYMIFALIRLTGFSKLGSYEESVLSVQKEIAFQKKRLFKFRKIEYLLAPLFIFSALNLLVKGFHHYDIYQYPLRYVLTAVVTCVIGIAGGMWYYRIFYDKRIASVEALLKSITEFEKTEE